MNTSPSEKVYRAFSRLNDTDKLEFLNRLKSNITNNNQVVAYTVEGVPLTQAQYIAEIEEAINEGLRGETITHDELLSQMKQW